MKLEVLERVPMGSSNVPPLLFVHGAFHGAGCWTENFLPYFSSKGFPCYALSLRGHGASEGLERLHTFSLSDYVQDVLEVMTQLQEKPVLIGHSMGGALVQAIAQTYPDQIKAVVLLATAPPNGILLKDMLRLSLTHFRELFQLLAFNQRKHGDFPLQLFFSQPLNAEERGEFALLLQPESRKAIRDLRRRIIPGPTRGLGAEPWAAPALQVPMLILGSKKDALFPEETVKRVGKVYKTQPIIFSDIGHDMMLDAGWRSVADRIHIFLDEIVLAGGKAV